jgi:hypothetical protein
MEVAECTYRGGDKYDIRPLWTYEVDEEHRNEEGKTIITGYFTKVNFISGELAQKLSDNGMPWQKLKRYVGGEDYAD